ncbi:MAG: hypothetical protein K2L75_07945 [Muribaculaceae bacterium]|nr:hypothetical protein [Muribaculaceae bacterium]MDE6527174.1 hypothetical protein [Muribaculaceae bacterium]
MKKLVLMLAVVFSMSFFACGNKEQATEAAAEEVAVEEVAPVVEEAAVAVDSLNDSTVVVEAAEAVEAPVAE